MNIVKTRAKGETPRNTEKIDRPGGNSKNISAKIEKVSEEFWKEISESSATSEFPIWRMWR